MPLKKTNKNNSFVSNILMNDIIKKKKCYCYKL